MSISNTLRYLQGHELIVNHDLLREEISTNGSLVLCRELLVDILVHKGRLAHPAEKRKYSWLRKYDKAPRKLRYSPAIAQDNDLEQHLLPGRHVLVY